MKKFGKKILLSCCLLAALIPACSSGRQAVGFPATPEITDGGAIFRYHDPGAKRVYLVGDFNNWSPFSDPMKDTDGDGSWELFFPLAPGSYAYKLIVDGKWIPDPHNPLDEPDGFGGRNSIARIPASR